MSIDKQNIKATPYTDEEIERCRVARSMLEPPGDEVAGRLIANIDALRARLATRDARIAQLEGVLANVSALLMRCRPYVCTIQPGNIDPASEHAGDQIAYAIDAHLAAQPPKGAPDA